MIELVVFDMAGTTVHDGDAVRSAFHATLGASGIEVDAAIVDSVMGLPKPDALRILLASAGRAIRQEEIDELHTAFTARICEYYASSPEVREIPGALAVFSTLRKAGIKVALNTGFFRPIVDVLLARLGWRSPEVIDAVVTSDEVPRGRPHPDMILHLMERLGIQDAGRVAKVGDTTVDMEEGISAGCKFVIGVLSGTGTLEQFRACPHTHIVPSIVDVPAIILS